MATWTTWTGTSSATTTGIVWNYWNTGAGNTTTVYTADFPQLIWANWVNATATTTIASGWKSPTYCPPVLSPEEQAAERVARAEREERAVKERADHEQAVQRAEILLNEHLNAAQRSQLKARGRFKLRSQRGSWYEIRRGHHSNVVRLNEDGQPTETLCVYARGGVPDADCMLAQKLYLEMNEDRLREVAHITPAGGF
jgi:hypothetical protein